jgi:hypothetical protein
LGPLQTANLNNWTHLQLSLSEFDTLDLKDSYHTLCITICVRVHAHGISNSCINSSRWFTLCLPYTQGHTGRAFYLRMRADSSP